MHRSICVALLVAPCALLGCPSSSSDAPSSSAAAHASGAPSSAAHAATTAAATANATAAAAANGAGDLATMFDGEGSGIKQTQVIPTAGGWAPGIPAGAWESTDVYGSGLFVAPKDTKNKTFVYITTGDAKSPAPPAHSDTYYTKTDKETWEPAVDAKVGADHLPAKILRGKGVSVADKKVENKLIAAIVELPTNKKVTIIGAYQDAQGEKDIATIIQGLKKVK